MRLGRLGGLHDLDKGNGARASDATHDAVILEKAVGQHIPAFRAGLLTFAARAGQTGLAAVDRAQAAGLPRLAPYALPIGAAVAGLGVGGTSAGGIVSSGPGFISSGHAEFVSGYGIIAALLHQCAQPLERVTSGAASDTARAHAHNTADELVTTAGEPLGAA
ncbi:hypothetical protein [Streptomyces sp. NPDC048611]|uniref:hypothetical protein n=1 Tax=Streptomyces sp. NPDC048611 TaxID=3155635 RepID=UPI003443C6B0